MKAIFVSAAKIVFILVAVTACAAFLIGTLESKDFMALAMLAFAFYFGTPSTTPVSELGGVK